MTDDELEADAKAGYELYIKIAGKQVKETGIIPECLLGDGEHSRRLRAEYERRAEYDPRSIRSLLSEALAAWIPRTVETSWFRIRARRALTKQDDETAGRRPHP